MNKKVIILLVDDHLAIRHGISLMLNHQKQFIPEIIQANDGEEAIKIVEQQHIDIILMDINMPNRDGISATKYLTTNYPDSKVLALSVHYEDFIIKQMLNAGAKGYLLKSIDTEGLSTAILNILESKQYFSNDIAQPIVNQNSIISPKISSISFPKYKLTKREKEVLLHIGDELTSAEISEKLKLSVRTVEGHRHNLLKKFNIKSSAGLIKYALSHNNI